MGDSRRFRYHEIDCPARYTLPNSLSSPAANEFVPRATESIELLLDEALGTHTMRNRLNRKHVSRPRIAASNMRIFLAMIVFVGIVVALQHFYFERKFEVPNSLNSSLAKDAHGILPASRNADSLESAENARRQFNEPVTNNPFPSPRMPVAAVDEQHLNAVRLATVRVINQSDHAEGSGAVVGHSGPFCYVLSASHIVHGAKSISIQTASDHSPSERRPTEAQTIEVVAESMATDLVLLRVTGNFSTKSRLPICPIASVPKRFPVSALAAGWSQIQQPVVKPVEVLREATFRKVDSKIEVKMWEVNGESIMGRSGGPLIDPHGFLIGIASGTSGGKSYFAYITSVHELLHQNGMKWLLESDNIPQILPEK